MDARSLPKVELHLHLDCSLSYEVVHRIDPSVSEDEYRRDFIAPAKCTNLADFLTRAPMGFGLMQTPEQLSLVTYDLFQQLQRDGVIYAEIRFAPLLHLQKGLTPEEVVRAVNDAAELARAEHGVEARLILCTLRHFSRAESLQTAELVERFEGTLVAALDIAGDEAGYPIDAHVDAFQYAIDRAIARTAHAGEARGADSVWETLRALEPSRIGHGVRSVEDPELVAYLAERRVHLEVCPTSNIQTNIYDTYADHPVDVLYRGGVSLGINTDTRTITDITLTEEYERLAKTFGWGRKELLRCNLHSLDSAFLPADVKDTLRARLRDAYGDGSRT